MIFRRATVTFAAVTTVIVFHTVRYYVARNEPPGAYVATVEIMMFVAWIGTQPFEDLAFRLGRRRKKRTAHDDDET